MHGQEFGGGLPGLNPKPCRGQRSPLSLPSLSGTPTEAQLRAVESYLPPGLASALRKRGLSGPLYDWQVPPPPPPSRAWSCCPQFKELPRG